MVAASGGEGSLRPAVAVACLAGVLVGLVLIVLTSRQATLLGRAPPELPPEVLVHKARDILRTLGHDSPPGDSAFGFRYDNEYVGYIEKESLSPMRWDVLENGRPSAVFFWYRQSPGPLMSTSLFYAGRSPWTSRGLVTPDDPPPVRSNMAFIKLDPTGHLLEFQVVPPQQVDPEALRGNRDWKELFQLAGFQFDQFTCDAKGARWNPPFPTDPPLAWIGKGVFEAWPDIEVRVEAATYQGKPVYFRVIGPWTRPERDQSYTSSGLYSYFWNSLMIGLTLIGAALAVRNARLGRGDHRGAFRLGLVIFLTGLASWLFSAGHVKVFREIDLIMTGVAHALLASAIIWLAYLALEPFVRRLWPQVLISWTRLLAGRFRDPVVGRDLLVGAVGGVAFYLLAQLSALAPSWLGLPPAAVDNALELLGAGRYWVGEVLERPWVAIFFALTLWLMFFLVLRVILRKPLLAAGVWVAFWTMLDIFFGMEVPFSPISWAALALRWIISLAILLRCGLAAAAVMGFVLGLLWFPILPDLSAWYVRNGLYSIIVIIALAGYGFVISLGGRPLFGRGWLGEE
jgi:serine/threonine-protein kinase